MLKTIPPKGEGLRPGNWKLNRPDLGPTLSSMCPNVELKGPSDPAKQLKIIDFSELGSFATLSLVNSLPEYPASSSSRGPEYGMSCLASRSFSGTRVTYFMDAEPSLSPECTTHYLPQNK